MLGVKSNGVELTWLTSSTPALGLIDFIQKSHVLKDKRLDISLRTFIGVETAALTFRTKQYSTSYSSHICYGKRPFNDFFLNHHTMALVNNFFKLLNCVVIETVLDFVKKRISYLNGLLSTRKRTTLTSSRTVLNAMIAMHVHRQLSLIILLLGIREKVKKGELFSLL